MKQVHQSGKRISVSRDRSRSALPVGWRVSKTGNKYFESRKNRTDMHGKKL
jgi:hypothetical protein